MTRSLTTVFTILLLSCAFARIGFGADKTVLEDEDDRISYSVGYQMGNDFKKQELKIQPEAFLKGIEDALSDAEPLLTKEEMERTLVELKKRVTALERKQRAERAGKNLQEGKDFMEKNAGNKGVVTLPSGLQYRIIEEGGGTSPGPLDTVTVHYRGTLIDRTEFDSSFKRGQPATFQVDRVIKGWTEALQLMKEGSKWELFIPPDLAYGTRGAGSVIGPNSTLIFEVELITVIKR